MYSPNLMVFLAQELRLRFVFTAQIPTKVHAEICLLSETLC